MYDNWVPIGIRPDPVVEPRYKSSSTPLEWRPGVFYGTFDGGGYIINNLTITRPNADYQGLFGYIGRRRHLRCRNRRRRHDRRHVYGYRCVDDPKRQASRPQRPHSGNAGAFALGRGRFCAVKKITFEG